MNTIQLKLTKWLWLRPLRMTFKKVDTVTLTDGEAIEVIVYAAKYTGRIAQCTPFGTIIVDELSFVSPRYLMRVVTHELAHKHQWYGYLLYPLVIVFAPFLAFLFLGVIIYLVFSLFNPQFLLLSLFILILMSIITIVFCSYSWFVEYKAEAVTFKKIGIDNVLEIDKQFKPSMKAPLQWRIAALLTHPPQSLVVRIYRHFNKSSDDL